MDKLYLGVAREIITPKVGGQMYGYRPDFFSEAVADDLTATAFYFKQGATQCLMISITVCIINTELNAAIQEQISKRLGIPADCCMLCATHTHSGPNVTGCAGWGDIDRDYCDTIFVPKLLSVAEKAMEHTVPVTLGVASGDSYVGVNRRELTLENKITFGQNPWGSFNPTMTVLSFQDETGKTVGNMIHYGTHCTAAGHNREITRDWPGVMTDALEKDTGALTAFFNGPEGDVGPRLSNGKTVGNLELAYELGAVAARDAREVYSKISQYKTPRLQVCANSCAIPLKPRMDVETAKAVYEKYKDRTVNISGMMKTTALAVLRAHEEGVPERSADEFTQTAVALDDTVFVGFPYELFSEIGMRIDRAFPGAQVLSIANANGSQGYFITQDAVCRGGYEVDFFLHNDVQTFVEDGDWHMVTGTVENLKNIIKEEETL